MKVIFFRNKFILWDVSEKDCIRVEIYTTERNKKRPIYSCQRVESDGKLNLIVEADAYNLYKVLENVIVAI